MGEGTKGPRWFDWVCLPMLQGCEDDGQHWMLIRRLPTDPTKKVYYVVFGPVGTTLAEMVEAISARWHIEEDFETGKDSGMDQYARPDLDCVVSGYHPRYGGSSVPNNYLCARAGR
jgi:hypothetical protein